MEYDPDQSVFYLNVFDLYKSKTIKYFDYNQNIEHDPYMSIEFPIQFMCIDIWNTS